jgi:hypothetical protein
VKKGEGGDRRHGEGGERRADREERVRGERKGRGEAWPAQLNGII